MVGLAFLCFCLPLILKQPQQLRDHIPTQFKHSLSIHISLPPSLLSWFFFISNTQYFWTNKVVRALFEHLSYPKTQVWKNVNCGKQRNRTMSGKPVRPRTRVGKYELGKTIGEGSFAKVKFAKNVENGNHVAIKILDRNHVLRHKMMEQARIIWISFF